MWPFWSNLLRQFSIENVIIKHNYLNRTNKYLVIKIKDLYIIINRRLGVIFDDKLNFNCDISNI